MKEFIKRLFTSHNQEKNKSKKQIIINNEQLIEKVSFIIDNLISDNILLRNYINNKSFLFRLTNSYEDYFYRNINLNDETIKKLITLKAQINNKKNNNIIYNELFFSIIKNYNNEKNNLNKEYAEILFYNFRNDLMNIYCPKHIIEKFDSIKDSIISYSNSKNVTIIEITDKIYSIYLNLLHKNRKEVEAFEENIKPIILKCINQIDDYILIENHHYIIEFVYNKCLSLRSNKLFIKNPELFINNMIKENIEVLRSLKDMLNDYDDAYQDKKRKSIINVSNKKNKVRKRVFK